MRKRVEGAIAEISDNGWAKDLQGCRTLKERYQKLVEFLPEIREFFPSIQNQLFFHIQKNLEINLGVCEFFMIEGRKRHDSKEHDSKEIEEREQYCTYGGGKETCNCRVPQLFCVICSRNSKVLQKQQNEIARILVS